MMESGDRSHLTGSVVQRSMPRWVGNNMENRFSVLTPKATWLPLNSKVCPAPAVEPWVYARTPAPSRDVFPVYFWDARNPQLSSAELFPSFSRLPCVSANKSRLLAQRHYSKSPGGLESWKEHCWVPHQLKNTTPARAQPGQHIADTARATAMGTVITY